MPSVHIQYTSYSDVANIIFEAEDNYNILDIRDLYDYFDFGTIAFDFETAQDAMLFKLMYGGTYRING